MDRAQYILLLGIEAFFGVFATLLMCTWGLWREVIVILVIFAVLMLVLLKRWKKHKRTENAKGVKRVCIGLVLVMLIPILPAAYIVGLIIATLALYG